MSFVQKWRGSCCWKTGTKITVFKWMDQTNFGPMASDQKMCNQGTQHFKKILLEHRFNCRCRFLRCLCLPTVSNIENLFRVVRKEPMRLEISSTDLCGPMENASIIGSRYRLPFRDSCSNYCWVYSLRKKSEVITNLECFLNDFYKEFQGDGQES